MISLAVVAYALDSSPWIHVVVERGAPESGWFIASTIAAGLAALATTYLAFITRNLAIATRQMAKKTADLAAETATQVKETAGAIEQTERHHQESLAPILFLSVDCRMSLGADGLSRLIFSGEVRNVGPGPAVKVYLYIRPVGYGARRIFLGVIGANSASPMAKQVDYGYGQVPRQGNSPYDALLVYETIFGTEGAMWQHSYSGSHEGTEIGEHVLPGAASKDAVEKLLQRDWADFTVG